MVRQRTTTVIIGEGPTEFYYLNSLKDRYRQFQNVKPSSPKNTSLRELQRTIEESIRLGYNKIFYLIDMDNKRKDKKSNSDYIRLKKKLLMNDRMSSDSIHSHSNLLPTFHTVKAR